MDEKTYSRIVLYSYLILTSVILGFIMLGGQPAVSSSFVNAEEKFNCSKGVSIETSKVCDGRKDCSDGSDETIGLCARNDEYRKKISVKQYRSTKEKFNCSNGVSIETSKVCDGRKDCSDGSDETIGLCARNEYRNNFSTECGKVHYTNQEKIENGQNAIFGTAPWHVGIYRFVNNVSNYELLCGGSLISSHLVISGARCFWYHRRYTSNKISNIDGLYKIAVGKYDRNISIIDNNFTQIMDVANVYVEKGGFFEYLNNKIAIVVLRNPVSFSYYVAPVCIDWNGEYNVVNDDRGKIVSWGYPNNGSISPIALELSLSYVDLSTCQKMYPNVSRTVLTFDKFCTASKLGPDLSVQYDGDGLSFFHNNSYYLTGVTGIKNPLSSLTVFTEVKHHVHWILRLYNKHK